MDAVGDVVVVLNLIVVPLLLLERRCLKKSIGSSQKDHEHVHNVTDCGLSENQFLQSHGECKVRKACLINPECFIECA